MDDPEFSLRFPAERVARVRIEMVDGTVLDSGETQAAWDGVTSPTDDRAAREVLLAGR